MSLRPVAFSSSSFSSVLRCACAGPLAFCWNHMEALGRLRETLQKLPQRLGETLASFGDTSGDVFLGSVTGDYNYKFNFRLEGGGYFQTGVLVASAQATNGGMPVPLRCHWKRRVGDLLVEIPGVTSNMYQISADDVGTDIIVEAQPAVADLGHTGRAVGEIGPFELDPATRRSLDNVLGHGGRTFTALQVGPDGKPRRDLQGVTIEVASESVKVASKGSNGTAPREVVVEFSQEYPKILIHPLEAQNFQFIVNGSKQFHLAATSRTARDLIALTVRAFHARKYLNMATILQALLPIQAPLQGAVGAMTPSKPPDVRLDCCIFLERITRELNRTMQQKETGEKVHRNTSNEKKQLQAQLVETIHGFTEVIAGLQDKFTDTDTSCEPVSIERLEEQLREATIQNKALLEELQATRQETERLNLARVTAEARGAGATVTEVQRLKQEADVLRTRLIDLSTSPKGMMTKEEADKAHMMELKHLRRDVEALHQQKEALREELQDRDRERQELQDNFLYVKSQLDKVQVKQAERGVDGVSELQRHRQSLSTMGEERTKLSQRLEATINELEREKAYHEQSLERVMTANARLLEEKERNQKEVQRFSELYAAAISDVQQSPSRSGTNLDNSMLSFSADLEDQADMKQLRGDLDKLDVEIKRKDEENESLKNRIRKLAVA